MFSISSVASFSCDEILHPRNLVCKLTVTLSYFNLFPKTTQQAKEYEARRIKKEVEKHRKT
jgi:hypothetical protein